MKVIKESTVTWKCTHCNSILEGEAHEFKELHTNPPMYLADCPVCLMQSKIFDKALCARTVGRM